MSGQTSVFFYPDNPTELFVTEYSFWSLLLFIFSEEPIFHPREEHSLHARDGLYPFKDDKQLYPNLSFGQMPTETKVTFVANICIVLSVCIIALFLLFLFLRIVIRSFISVGKGIFIAIRKKIFKKGQ